MLQEQQHHRHVECWALSEPRHLPLLLNFATAIMSASASDDIDKHVLRKYEIVSVSVYH